MDYSKIQEVYAQISWEGSSETQTLGLLLPSLIVANNFATVLEIGIGSGFLTKIVHHTLACWATTPTLLISCDKDWPPVHNMRTKYDTQQSPVQFRALHVDTSTATAWHQISELLAGLSLGLSIIDGGHEYETAKNDLTQSAKLLDEKGLLVCHDYHPGHPGVVQAIDEFFAEGQWNKLLVPGRRLYEDYTSAILQRR